jgi:hypothetical protein
MLLSNSQTGGRHEPSPCLRLLRLRRQCECPPLPLCWAIPVVANLPHFPSLYLD